MSNIVKDALLGVSIADGLAGILYRADSIPENWVNNLARKNDIINLSNKLFEKYTEHTRA